MDSQAAAIEPKSVAQAVNLLWASLATGLAKVFLDFSHISASAPAVTVFSVMAITFAIMAILIIKIKAGRNWARITFLIMFVIGLLPTLPLIMGEFLRAPVVGVISVGQAGIQGYALFLLFSHPGKTWFSKQGK